MAEKQEKNQVKARFISSVLGEVSPVNILTEYFGCFRGHKKFKAYFLSWLDGEIYKKLKSNQSPWVYVVCHELADRFGCCRDTVQRHLKELCDMGILKRLPYSRWATDKIWQYTIDCSRLLTHLFSTFTKAMSKNSNFGVLWIGLLSKTQTVECLNSDNQVSEFRQPGVGVSATYTNTNPSPTLTNTQIDDVGVDIGNVKEEKPVLPTDEEVGLVSTEIRALSPEFQINPNVKSAIYLNWANVPSVLSYLREAVRTWKVRPDFNWTGLLVKSLKQGVEHRYEPPEKYPRPANLKPTLEQLNILGSIGDLIYGRHINEPGLPEVLCILREGCIFTWWEALARFGGSL